MQKIFVAVLCIISGIGVAFGESDAQKMMKLTGCSYGVNGGVFGVFCGGGASYRCLGRQYEESERTVIYSCGSDEASCSILERNWACCGGSATKRGTFVEYTKGAFLTPNTKELDGGGTCTYYTNPCGDVVTDCNEPDACPLGQVLRTVGTTKVCAELCGENRGYANENSVECIECSTAGHNRGVDANGNCVKCDSGSLFKSKDDCTGQDCCHSKSKATIYTQSQMAECFRCGTKPTVFHDCLAGNSDARQQCGLK